MPSSRASGPRDAASCGTRDVLDDVLQRLFATGIGLQVLADREPDAAAASQLRRHIAELDDTIEEVRSQVVAPIGGHPFRVFGRE